MRFLYSFKVLPYKILITKRRKSNFIVEKPDRQQLNQVTKVNTINNGTNQNHIPPERMQRENTVSLYDLPAKDA